MTVAALVLPRRRKPSLDPRLRGETGMLEGYTLKVSGVREYLLDCHLSKNAEC